MVSSNVSPSNDEAYGPCQIRGKSGWVLPGLGKPQSPNAVTQRKCDEAGGLFGDYLVGRL